MINVTKSFKSCTSCLCVCIYTYKSIYNIKRCFVLESNYTSALTNTAKDNLLTNYFKGCPSFLYEYILFARRHLRYLKMLVVK